MPINLGTNEKFQTNILDRINGCRSKLSVKSLNEDTDRVCVFGESANLEGFLCVGKIGYIERRLTLRIYGVFLSAKLEQGF